MLGRVAGWIVGAQRGQGKGELDTLEALFMEPREKEPEAQLQVEMESWGQEVIRGQQQLLPAHLLLRSCSHCPGPSAPRMPPDGREKWRVRGKGSLPPHSPGEGGGQASVSGSPGPL